MYDHAMWSMTLKVTGQGSAEMGIIKVWWLQNECCGLMQKIGLGFERKVEGGKRKTYHGELQSCLRGPSVLRTSNMQTIKIKNCCKHQVSHDVIKIYILKNDIVIIVFFYSYEIIKILIF